MGRLDLVICAVGLLGHHAGLPLDPAAPGPIAMITARGAVALTQVALPCALAREEWWKLRCTGKLTVEPADLRL